MLLEHFSQVWQAAYVGVGYCAVITIRNIEADDLRPSLRMVTSNDVQSSPVGEGSANVSPNGAHVATASIDGLACTFTLDLEELITLAQSRVTRKLTTAECLQYLHVDACPEN